MVKYGSSKINFFRKARRGCSSFISRRTSSVDSSSDGVKINTTVKYCFNADKRETFLTLKNVALKQHDQIKALEFHTQEYQSHYEKLNWNNADKWILGFENSVSYFATKSM
jgi:hypothetical protein